MSDKPLGIVGIALTAVAALAAVAVVGIGIWAFKVVTSDIKGEGDAKRQINSADNRINSQEHFHSLMADILRSDKNLDQAYIDKKEHPGDTFHETNYSGLLKHCNEVVAQYNADAQKISKNKWIDPNLPQQIDSTDPTTDCKETL